MLDSDLSVNLETSATIIAYHQALMGKLTQPGTKYEEAALSALRIDTLLATNRQKQGLS